MKGIILAGGSGTRLFPVTRSVCKQLLPVFDKPLIYYPLSTLMLAGIRDILVISTPDDTPRFKQLLGDGGEIGVRLSYKVQDAPNGLAEAFILGRDFIADESVALILGDNIFYGHSFPELLEDLTDSGSGATVFGYHVQDPERFGVVEFSSTGKVLSLEEKPEDPKSNFAVVGLYFYDNSVVDIAANLKPSPRGELEITDVNRKYLEREQLTVKLMGRGYTWFDTGTHSALMDAANFVRTIQERSGLMVGCIEEVAYRKGYISSDQLKKLGVSQGKSSYGEYLIQIAEEVSLAF